MLTDTYACARLRFAENGTYNAFKPAARTESRIDHIFVSPTFDVRNYAVLTNGYWTRPASLHTDPKTGNAPQEIDTQQYDRRVPSDHYPVLARITYVR